MDVEVGAHVPAPHLEMLCVLLSFKMPFHKHNSLRALECARGQGWMISVGDLIGPVLGAPN